ncbi:sigma-70 family RNA polymerase sigma factor [Sphingobium sp. H33]|uniref:Sigma-70 family RNA polymerase sigma factor n=1 Tax=Sphingobium nicotianae TaxID=2782607 RepID=A0A9X1DB20_9SPHN|nr:sigma-70 family RNA polymerase sigma factor [Sphingobium nicotianae]
MEAERRSGEADLLARVRLRDLAAFEGLYRLYHPRLSRFVTSLVRRHPLVEEVVNDTMMVLWDKPESYGGQAKLSTWLYAIAYRKAIRARLRQDEPVEDGHRPELGDDDAPPDRDFGRRRAAAILQSAIEELSPDHRAVVHLTYFQEIGYREIADILGCPVDTVKTRMFHARRHLKRKLSGELADWI